ncbi:MAG: hypothetical protein ACSHYA_13215 [Opitutaceae bacterium]
MNAYRFSLITLGSLLLTTSVQAQLQLKSGTFNSLRKSGVPIVQGNSTTTPQFAGHGATTATAGAISDAPEYYDQFPAGKQITGVAVTGGVVLARASVGGVFASGVPRYALGDEILPPTTGVGGNEIEPANYWRSNPVAVGEQFTHPGAATAVDPSPLPAAAPTYYYSPHANRVFAHQPGRVSVLWVTQQPVGPAGTTEAGDNPKEFRFKQEIFSVSSGTGRPVRTIYWTERTFNGPEVNIPTGRIVTVNPVYNDFFPASADEEYQAVGQTPADPNQPELKKTLWFEKTAGLGQLHAYNFEGRILIEYLGELEGDGVHAFLGADIVQVLQVAPSTTASVPLGEQILPYDVTGQLPENADALLPEVVQSLGQDSVTYYGTSARPDGKLIYHAEWENDNPDKVAFYWLEESDAAIHFLDAPESPNLGIAWPKYLNKYLQTWPDFVPGSFSEYAGVTVADAGSNGETGVQFSGGSLPTLIYQDDINQTEASIDINSQSLVVDFSDSNDLFNRTLLKFTSTTGVWYQRVFIQSQSLLGSAEVPDDPSTEEVNEFAPAVYTLADLNADGVRDLIFGGGDVIVGQRIERPSADFELAGYIAAGDGYQESAYQNPFVAGVDAASAGAIIPVNATPGSNEFTIWWFSKIEAPDTDFESFYVPSVSAHYSVSWPTTSEHTGPDQDQIIMASNAGTGDLSPAQAAGTVYIQNTAGQIGYNPNEEHALMLGGRAYALRDDLNVTTQDSTYTSDPFVLIAYEDPEDGRPAMRVFEVLRELDLAGTNDDVLFNYPVTAGAQVPAPMPLPLLPLPINSDGNVWNQEVEVLDGVDLAPNRQSPVTLYDTFTYEDRKGYTWVYRGPHAGIEPTMGMQFYYTMRDGFFVPSVPSQPAVGDVLPYLRPLNDGVPEGDPVNGTPLTVLYRPVWPDIVPELRIAETLTLPKFGLPQVRGQSSAEVLYQQSIANEGPEATSVTLHDPTRAKRVYLAELPSTIATTIYNGRTYFQRLPPHLQQRVYIEDDQLVFAGEFVDELAGEDYLNLNVLSASDVTALKGLTGETDPAWDSTVDGLLSTVETFAEDPAQKGTFIVDSFDTVNGTNLSTISDSDTAVDSYALTATGQGSGYVSLLFGDGEAFTAEGDPVSVGIIQVTPRLYVGDMKVQFSSNPLDEQVTLRHSGDFAARPEDYQFEWRYASLVDGLPPATYEYNDPSAVLDNTTDWTVVQNPASNLPTVDEYASGNSVSVPRTLVLYDEGHGGGSLPGLVAKSDTDVDFSSGLPAQVIFSTDLSSDLDGFVLYVNDIEVLAFRAPDPFSNSNSVTGLSATGLSLQFDLSPNYFVVGANTIEVALYSDADPLVSSQVNFRLETVTRTDRVDPAVYVSSPWLQPSGDLENIITLGGSPTAPLGNPLLLLQDNAFTVRYRPLLSSANILTGGKATQGDVAWSDWMDAQVIPGWIKRVLDGINPYNQRVTDLFNNAINTDVSVLTQAGTRWEGDIALNLENVNDSGLIEIYETVLNRAKLFSIDNGYDVPGVNDALLLAAGYLNDLYIILGNEAYADAANPTISLDDQDTITEVNTSRFSFEGQVASSLDEELGLLRGRDDFLATSVATAPAYNRLYWNYTNGIDSGEVLYGVNYNIKEKAGSETADGIIDAADAQRMFPQAHGDAYGHYLTALKGYYRLLTNPNFTWTPRSEVVSVLGQNVSVDYFDERKFAGAASHTARTAEQILSLTWRQAYQDDSSAGWSQYRDNQSNSRTNVNRQWGVDEWASRATSGAYINWLVGNAMLPDVDNNSQHTGIQIVDRSTVPELTELTVAASNFQTTLDNANARLNPLGLSPDAIAFDISPAELKAGKSHYEQVYERALTSVLNAKGAFDQAGRMTGLLRNQENQIDDFNTALEDEERAYTYQLIDLYGSPYTGDVGPGKTYAQNYEGPDLYNWFVVDRPSELIENTAPITINARVPINVQPYAGFAITDVYSENQVITEEQPITIQPNQYVQFADQWRPGVDLGNRSSTGRIQRALIDQQLARMAVLEANDRMEDVYRQFDQKGQLLIERVKYLQKNSSDRENSADLQSEYTRLKGGLDATSGAFRIAAAFKRQIANAISEAPPKSVGFSNDATSAVRAAIKAKGVLIGHIATGVANTFTRAAKVVEALKEKEKIELELLLIENGLSFEDKQVAYEFGILQDEMIHQFHEVAQLAVQLQQASEDVRTVMAIGDRIQSDRELFRQRASAIVQGYRTKDLTFRVFRNEALEQYRTLFDLASRYTYLAAKSYDYETGLLGTTEGQSVINKIVSSRALGDLTGGVPQATVSTLGDAGLAGTMAQMNADFAVAEGRLGINNPDQNGTLFSLRQELFRILDDPDSTADDDAWQQILEQSIVSDLMADPDAATYCRSLSNSNGGRVPGIVISFSTTIRDGYNFFGLPTAGGDHAYSETSFATKIYSAGMVLEGYVGMDPYTFGSPNAGSADGSNPDALSASPYVYLIPTGVDYMLAPPLGDTDTVRSWNVVDQALPLPYNLGASDFNDTQFFQSNGTLSEQPWVIRKHQAFRPVNDPAFFYSLIPEEFTSSRLVGRSVWNGGWKIVIPAYTLLNDEEEGLDRFVRSVDDIKIFLRTYSNSGN